MVFGDGDIPIDVDGEGESEDEDEGERAALYADIIRNLGDNESLDPERFPSAA